MKGVIEVLLSSEKRLEVRVAGHYRGLRLFKPARRLSEQPAEPNFDFGPDHSDPSPYTPRKGNSVRELVLK